MQHNESPPEQFIPYGRQLVSESDIEAVVDVLRSDWLTTGPKVSEFENAIAQFTRAEYAVALSSGTAALHAAMYSIGIGPGDEVIVPAITFAATANCVVFQGGTPVIVDVDSETLLIDPAQVEQHITLKTKAIIAVDYAGQPCDYKTLTDIAQRHGLFLVADACHSLGAKFNNEHVGTLADLTLFSFHPVKPITTGEGGIIVTNSQKIAEKAKLFRNHGITTDHKEREEQGTWFYEMVDLGFNYRISDLQCALGVSQLQKLPWFIEKRQKIADSYDQALMGNRLFHPLQKGDNVSHAFHLYVVKVDFVILGFDRTALFKMLREKGIGVNVHYVPVHLHPFYREKFHTTKGQCPVAEECYQKIMSLPVHAGLTDSEQYYVIEQLQGFSREQESGVE